FHRRNKSQTAQPQPQPQFQTPAQAPAGLTPRPVQQQPQPTRPQAPAFGFTTPLPRPEAQTRPTLNIPSIEDDSIAKAQTAVNEILKNLNQKRQIDFLNDTERMSIEMRKSRPLFAAAGLDAMLIVAAFLMSMIAMLSITKVDLFLNLSHPETSGLIYIATGMLFIGVSFIYMVVNRAFMGHTPGEWAYDQNCGQPADMQNLTYIPRLVFRTVLVIATGFITMPLLSALMNKDVAGQITGTTLYRKPNA
ncbi:MAG: metalloendopeptidase, partial [Bdellovibrionaceae bacterium]|nr:metalloendopeptidase [Pseudobdellovibrionaceae bacterium]